MRALLPPGHLTTPVQNLSQLKKFVRTSDAADAADAKRPVGPVVEIVGSVGNLQRLIPFSRLATLNQNSMGSALNSTESPSDRRKGTLAQVTFELDAKHLSQSTKLPKAVCAPLDMAGLQGLFHCAFLGFPFEEKSMHARVPHWHPKC